MTRVVSLSAGLALLAMWAAVALGGGAAGARAAQIGADGSKPPGATTWKVGMNGGTRVVATTDEVVFAWSSSTHSVAQFPDKAAYDACDFSGATTLVSSRSGANFVMGPTTGAATFYIGCGVGSHCNAGQKVALVFTPGGSKAPTSPPSATAKPTASAAPTTPTAPVVCSAIKKVAKCRAAFPQCMWKKKKCQTRPNGTPTMSG